MFRLLEQLHRSMLYNPYYYLYIDTMSPSAGDLCIFPRGDVYLEQYHPNAVDNFDRWVLWAHCGISFVALEIVTY